MKNSVSNKLVAVFGLGMSGLATARYLEREGIDFAVVDTRSQAPGIEDLIPLQHCQAQFLGEPISQAAQEVLNSAAMIVLSPGVAIETASIQIAIAKGVEIIGDIELFARECKGKIIAITGSNGKSTVTDLTCELLKAAGKDAVIGGNFGVPVLDLLPSQTSKIYVLELSSFQLDTTRSLKADVAVVLNVSADHMDRYASFDAYRKSKLSIFNRAKKCLVNGDDSLTQSDSVKVFAEYSLQNANADYSLIEENNNRWLVAKNQKCLTTNELALVGSHNWSNALAALAIVNELAINLDDKVIKALKIYAGLPHRFQRVSRDSNCDWVNDSKATNPGATIAALASIEPAEYAKVILVAGGDAKGGDLSPLKQPLADKVDHLILLGKDAALLAKLFAASQISFAKDMQDAVAIAKQQLNSESEKKSLVLLSPACASLDMYKNFAERGLAFVDAVGGSK